MLINSFGTGAYLSEKINHRTPPETLEVGDIGTERPAYRTETGHLKAARLIDQNPVDGILCNIMFDFFEKPVAKGLVIEARNLMMTPVTIHYTRLRVAKCVPAWYK